VQARHDKMSNCATEASLVLRRHDWALGSDGGASQMPHSRREYPCSGLTQLHLIDEIWSIPGKQRARRTGELTDWTLTLLFGSRAYRSSAISCYRTPSAISYSRSDQQGQIGSSGTLGARLGFRYGGPDVRLLDPTTPSPHRPTTPADLYCIHTDSVTQRVDVSALTASSWISEHSSCFSLP
jgi:hypothetical protein